MRKEIADPETISIILRDKPDVDCDELAADLRANYPDECYMIRVPIDHIYNYFDHKDVHMHGEAFLKCVLQKLVFDNQRRTIEIVNFAESWGQRYPERLQLQLSNPSNLNVFDEEDIQEYGKQFLFDVLCYINPALRSIAVQGM